MTLAAVVWLLCASPAGAYSTIRTDLDKETVDVGETFKLSFSLPKACAFADVPLSSSDALEIVSKDYGQKAGFSTVKVTEGGEDAPLQVQHDFAQASSRLTYVLKARKPGRFVFRALKIPCGDSIARTFERVIRATGGAAAPAAPAPPPEAAPEDPLVQTPAIQNLASRGPSELQLLDKELGNLRRSTATLQDLSFNEVPETDRSVLGRLRAYYEAWMARISAAKRVWTLEAFGVSSDAAPFLAGGLFLAAALGVLARDYWKRAARRRADLAKLPKIEVRGPKTDPPEKS